jgi:serine/threonine protein kinase
MYTSLWEFSEGFIDIYGPGLSDGPLAGPAEENKPSILNARHPSPSKVWNGYQLGRTLGKGEFATVKLAIDLLQNPKNNKDCGVNNSNNNLVAIKFIKIVSRERARVSREALVLASLDDAAPHIVPVKGVLGTDDGVAIIMKYCRDGELFDHVERQRGLSETEGRWFFRQLLEAVDYLHNVQGIVHRDIKLVSASL